MFDHIEELIQKLVPEDTTRPLAAPVQPPQLTVAPPEPRPLVKTRSMGTIRHFDATNLMESSLLLSAQGATGNAPAHTYENMKAIQERIDLLRRGRVTIIVVLLVVVKQAFGNTLNWGTMEYNRLITYYTIIIYMSDKKDFN
jgi:hypothetical protein